jgi:hypothetical protein
LASFAAFLCDLRGQKLFNAKLAKKIRKGRKAKPPRLNSFAAIASAISIRGPGHGRGKRAIWTTDFRHSTRFFALGFALLRRMARFERRRFADEAHPLNQQLTKIIFRC